MLVLVHHFPVIGLQDKSVELDERLLLILVIITNYNTGLKIYGGQLTESRKEMLKKLKKLINYEEIGGQWH